MAGHAPITRKVYWDDIDTMKIPKLTIDPIWVYELYLYQKKNDKSIPKYKVIGYDKEGVVELSDKLKSNEGVFSIKEITSHLTCENPMYEIPTAIDIETGEII